MAEFVCDPVLEPGETALVAVRTRAGRAFRWEPGGDADAYVAFVGAEFLAVVDGQVYSRSGPGQPLYPHDKIGEPHVVVRPVAGDPWYLSIHDFTTGWAAVVQGPPAALDDALADANAKLADALERANRLAEDLAAARGERDALHAWVNAPQPEYQLDNGEVLAVKDDAPVVPPTSETGESRQEPGEVMTTTAPAPAEPSKSRAKTTKRS